MKKLVPLLASAVLALAACGAPVKGVVVEKEHVPGYTDTDTKPVYSQVCSGTGQNRKCSQRQTGTRQVTETVPDKYYLIVETDEGETERDQVNRDVYDEYQVGETYDSENT